MACATLKRNLELDPLQSPRPTKRRRCAPLGTSPKITPNREPSISPFAVGRLSTETITTNVREEMRRLYRRKQLHFVDASSVRPVSPNSATSDTVASSTFPIKHAGEGLKDKPLFTFKQVGLICERMVREREQELQEIYERALTSKLAEQYDTFVKFTYDQLQKHFETSSAPSYLS